jgi:hypothetical protein
MVSNMDFQTELKSLLNNYKMESGSDTPDWILAVYLLACLNAFNAAVEAREKWYGRERLNS